MAMQRLWVAVTLAVVMVGVTTCVAPREHHSSHTNNWAVLVSDIQQPDPLPVKNLGGTQLIGGVSSKNEPVHTPHYIVCPA